MTEQAEINHLNVFGFERKSESISFVETMQVKEGVECDVYTFDDDPNKDLGIVRVAPGASTPRQKIIQGEKTIEGHISGKGRLIIVKPDGIQIIHTVDDKVNETKKPMSTTLTIGDIMQWQADPESDLSFYEICYPPYQDGRFENLPE